MLAEATIKHATPPEGAKWLNDSNKEPNSSIAAGWTRSSSLPPADSPAAATRALTGRVILCGARGWVAFPAMAQAGRYVSWQRVGLCFSSRDRGQLEEVVIGAGDDYERPQALSSSTAWRMDKVSIPPNCVKSAPSSVIRKRM